MEVKGVIHLIKETEVIGEKGFRKRLLVVRTEAKYKNLIPIEFTQDDVDMLDGYSEGDEVSVAINIGGQEWNGKYFPSINGWKIAKTDDAPEPKSNGSVKSNADAKAEKIREKASEATGSQEVDDDLPF